MLAKHLRVLSFAVAVTALVAATAILAPASDSPIKAACAAYSSAADAFLAEIGGEANLTYDALGDLPTPVLRRVISRVAPGTRSTLWTTHFDRFGADRPGMSDEQQRILERARLMTTAEFIEIALLDAGPETAVFKAMKELNDDALTVFSQEEVWALLFELGPGAGTSLATPISEGAAGRFLQGEECECIPWWGCIGAGQGCEETWECDETTIGCGFLMLNPCIGNCEWSTN